MQCSLPPPLSDDQISAALDGLAEPAVLAHLGACPSCAARLAEARTNEQRLRAVLYRWDCLAPELLGEYVEGRLAPAAVGALEAHLGGCARCRSELADLKQFLFAAPAVPAPQPARARASSRVIHARMLPHRAGAAMRGGGPGPLVAEAGDTTLFLDLQLEPGGGVALQGQLVAGDQALWDGALIELRQAGALAGTAAVDDLGSFMCEALPPGITELRVTSASGQMIVLPELDVRPGQ